MRKFKSGFRRAHVIPVHFKNFFVPFVFYYECTEIDGLLFIKIKPKIGTTLQRKKKLINLYHRMDLMKWKL